MGQKFLAIDVYRAMRDHVRRGGWLGAAWPDYVLPRGCKVTQAAVDTAVVMFNKNRFLVELARENWEREADCE